MKVFLVRHGDAVGPVVGKISDADRFLTEKGRVSINDVARQFKEMGEAPEEILTSPLVRAVQTAEILAAGIGFTGLVSVCSELRPPVEPHVTLDRIQNLARRSVMLVGHEPNMGVLARAIVGGKTFPSGFKKGALCSIELGAGDATAWGSFRWMLLPGRSEPITSVGDVP